MMTATGVNGVTEADEPLWVRSLRDLQKGNREERAAVGADTRTQTLGRRLGLVANEKRDRDRQFHQERRGQHDTHGRHLAQGQRGPDSEHNEANPIGEAREVSRIAGHGF
jgi:hypothetical protein